MLRSIHILGFHVPMYSLMLFLGILSFVLLFLHFSKEERKNDPVTFRRMLFVSCLSVALLGLSALLLNSLFHSIEKGKLVFGGITWLGGVVGGIPAFLLLTHFLVPKKKGYALDMLDRVMPGLAIGHGLGRLGCFFGGCCFGGVTDSPLGVVFPKGSSAFDLYPNAEGTASLPVYPTQLFEAGFECILFAVLMLLSRKKKQYNTAIWCMSYAVFRFLLEFLRGDDRGAVGFALSPSQFLSLFVFAFGLFALLMRFGISFPALRNRIQTWQSEADALPITVLGAPSKQADDPVALLEKLYALKEKGIITEEEYERKKAEILARM